MSIFDDFLNNGTLFKLLQKEGLIRNPFEKSLLNHYMSMVGMKNSMIIKI